MVTHFWWATWANLSWLLIFDERPEGFTHIAQFWWATWALCSHRSLKKREWANRSFFFKTYKRKSKKRKKYDLSQILLSESLVFVSKRANERFAKKKQVIRSFAHLSWANWGNISQLLFCHERPQRFAHCRSFNLSDLLTVAHLSWAIWANRSQSLIWSEQFKRMSNEQMRDEQMSKFPILSSFEFSNQALIFFYIKSANIF